MYTAVSNALVYNVGLQYKKYALYDRHDRQSQYTAIPPCNFKIMPRPT